MFSSDSSRQNIREINALVFFPNFRLSDSSLTRDEAGERGHQAPVREHRHQLPELPGLRAHPAELRHQGEALQGPALQGKRQVPRLGGRAEPHREHRVRHEEEPGRMDEAPREF